jgi:hypothetical protein
MRFWISILAILALGTIPNPARAADWKQLFNGKDMTGWEHVGPGKFVVENGMLKTEGGMGLLWYTREKIGNATIRVVFKLTHEDDNSGVYIRIPEKPTEPWMPVNKGYEVQIYNPGDDYHCTGALYSFAKVLARPYKPVEEWYTMVITLQGPHTVVVLNGTKVTDFTEGQPVPAKADDGEPDRGPRPNAGYFGLQNHGEGAEVYFKEVAVSK